MRLAIVIALGAGLACSPPSGMREQSATSRRDELAGTLVHTREGLVQGIDLGWALAWRAIPFAAPPVGDLRWRLPQPPARWDGVRDASAFSDVCPQAAGDAFAGSEDCLYLNVYAPAGSDDKRPVALFIHGGSRVAGDGQVLPPGLIQQGLVVVTIQYRLGALGYLGHRALTGESGTSGNWGFFDMIAALRWVQRNIRRFGGDPDRVLLFGQSAGGSAVNALLASPLAQGLFSRAAIESNALPPGRTHALAESESTGVALAQQLGCTGGDEEQLVCLRAAPAAAILAADLPIPPLLYPIDDGLFLEGDVALTLEQQGAGVPLMIGSTREEASRSLRALTDATEPACSARARADFPAIADQLLPLYPVSAYDSPYWALVALESDAGTTCDVRQLAQAVSSAEGAQPVYRYLFTHAYETGDYWPRFRAFHGADLPFVFGDFRYNLGDYAPTAAEKALAQEVQGYYARFAAGGDPNGDGAVAWPPFTVDDDNLLLIDDAIALGSGYHAAACDIAARSR